MEKKTLVWALLYQAAVVGSLSQKSFWSEQLKKTLKMHQNHAKSVEIDQKEALKVLILSKVLKMCLKSFKILQNPLRKRASYHGSTYY